ncbi:hypothetical protein AKJ57_00095 [candidate division MSBL1 archaeon SCGC-AAA259A05]|uniref:Uncharacterized protein n=1 Tax=candidate division MSBL1 archaeon SCGC-AAA259A05 TaxID=1698259 RepID=A0A133UC07_9EURY|nr:hypothetical protein AKJ57_00095 [candidate division MSBL1 archaeon SCGC-AAA259A05]
MVLAGTIILFIGIFLIVEAIFSIVYYFEGPELPQVFRVIRTFFGAYLAWMGAATYSRFESPELFWAQVVFFAIVGLSILAGYEVAKVLEERKAAENRKE